MLEQIKKVYGVDIEALRTEDSKEYDKKLNRKKKYKSSFSIPWEVFKEIYNCGIVKKPEIYRVIDKKFIIEPNGGFGYILTPRSGGHNG